MSDTRKILIIGASRGIGLGLTREFAGRGWHVVASERTPCATRRRATKTPSKSSPSM